MFKRIRNILQPDEQRRAQEFWTWFAANEQHYRQIQYADQEEQHHRIQVCLEHLQRYKSDLYFLTGKPKVNHPQELIITAAGAKAAIPAADYLVAAAPALKHWNIIALKPAQPNRNHVTIEGRKFALDQLHFAVHQVPELMAKGQLSLTLFFDPFVEEELPLYQAAAYALLEAQLGERMLAQKIGLISIGPLTADVPANVLRPLSSLPRLLAATSAEPASPTKGSSSYET